MDRRILYIGVILIILVIIGAIGVSLFSHHPDVTVRGCDITSLNLSSASLNVTLGLNSSYPIPIPVKKIGYAVQYTGGDERIRLAEGETGPFVLNPGFQEISFPVTVSHTGVIGSLLETVSNGEIRLPLSGSVSPDIFGFSPAVPFQQDVIAPVDIPDIIAGIGPQAGKMLLGRLLGI